MPTPGSLAQRDPGEQDDQAHRDHRRADADRQVPGHALVEHVPRRVAERGADDHRERQAVEHQADDELAEPARQPAGAQLGDRAEAGELAPDAGRGDGAGAAAAGCPSGEWGRRLTCAQSTGKWHWFRIANRD